LVNLLYSRSQKLRAVAAVIALSRTRTVRSVHLEFMGEEFAGYFDYPVHFSGRTRRALVSWIDRKELLRALVKTPVYRIFGALSKFDPERSPSDAVVRTWADDAEALYKDEFKTSVVFIYPFVVNISRGLRHIRRCFATYPHAYLMGVPYSFRRAVRLLWSRGRSFDLGLVDLELTAIRLHAHAFGAFRTVYTSDEYMVSSHALHRVLTKRGTKVVNKAHGIGFYGPCVHYSEMHVFNERQASHYARLSPHVPSQVQQRSVDENVYSAGHSGALVIVDQGDLRRHGFHYEYEVQQDVLRRAARFSTNTGTRLFIKFHPNRPASERRKVLDVHPEAQPLADPKSLAGFNLLFINLYSTTYFDWSHLGKFLFVQTEQFRPTALFGEDIRVASPDEFEETVAGLLDVQTSQGQTG
jgi:hypothetical protein